MLYKLYNFKTKEHSYVQFCDKMYNITIINWSHPCLKCIFPLYCKCKIFPPIVLCLTSSSPCLIIRIFNLAPWLFFLLNTFPLWQLFFFTSCWWHLISPLRLDISPFLEFCHIYPAARSLSWSLGFNLSSKWWEGMCT